jgi:hypothetical protein
MVIKVKIELDNKQKELLLSIIPNFDENNVVLVDLEETIENYVLEKETDEKQEITKKGEEFLSLHDYIVEKYDN